MTADFDLDRRDPASLAAISRPTLVVDRTRARRNIARMAAKARAGGTRFRPHFKTHQSPAIGEWFRSEGVEQITVSSVSMAVAFADHGWRDITIAFPFNPREAAALGDLSRRIRLGLLVDSMESVRLLIGSAIRAEVWLDIDVGYHRTGVPFDAADSLVAITGAIRAAPSLTFAGLLTHAGHTYGARSREDVRRIHDAAVANVRTAQATLRAAGIEAPISIGDTPGCSVAPGFDGIDEIRPGNFVFYDLQQLQTGACTEDDLALALACPVVGRYPDRSALVVHGGAVHLSKDTAEGPDGRPVFGRVAQVADAGWKLAAPDSYVSSVAQEHGTITCPPAVSDMLVPGSVVLVVPAHACLASAATGRFVALDGDPL